jgi:FixJ family two-component response regulator
MRPLIAIVDDDESVREALRSFFKSIGLQTELFACAQDFLDSSHLGDMSCLILDVLMPGMDGLELQRQLAARQLIPTIFIAGQADQNVRDTAMRAGAIGFLPKPFSEEILLKAVRTALESRGGGGQSRFQ